MTKTSHWRTIIRSYSHVNARHCCNIYYIFFSCGSHTIMTSQAKVNPTQIDHAPSQPTSTVHRPMHHHPCTVRLALCPNAPIDPTSTIPIITTRCCCYIIFFNGYSQNTQNIEVFKEGVKVFKKSPELGFFILDGPDVMQWVPTLPSTLKVQN